MNLKKIFDSVDSYPIGFMNYEIDREDLNDYDGYLTDSDMKRIAEEIGEIMIEEFGNEPEIDSQKKADEIEDTFKSLCMNYSYEEDDDENIDLYEIGNLLEDGYHSGYNPKWSINATIDGTSLSDYGLSTNDIDLIYRDIAYCVKDGNDNYYGLEVELEDGSTVYVDYEVEF